MTSHPELWREFKLELGQEENPTHPETVRRALIDFLKRHEDFTQQNAFKTFSAAQWKPGAVTARMRPPRQSLVNSLKDSLHRSLHSEEMTKQTTSSKPPISPLVPQRRLPPQRGSMPLRENKHRRHSHNQSFDGSEHSTSSASFHDDVDHAVRIPALPLKQDTAQQKLMRMQQIPHLWMMYQSERLEEQTSGMPLHTAIENSKSGRENAQVRKPFSPTADPSSLETFWNAHENEILEFEQEEEQARIAAAEQAKRLRTASKIHLELNTSFHLETSARPTLRHHSGHSTHSELRSMSEHGGFSIGSIGSAKMQQDPVQKKLLRIQQSPDLEFQFQTLLGGKENPKNATTIQETVEEFWIAHEKDVVEFERRISLLHVDLNTSFHEESVPAVHRPSSEHSTKTFNGHGMEKHTISGNPTGLEDKRTMFAAQRESLSTRSFRSIQTAVNDLTGELDYPTEKVPRSGSGLGRGRMDSHEHNDSRPRAKMLQKYKQQGEGFSMRSMRSFRMAVDDLAGEVGSDGAPATQEKSYSDNLTMQPGGMFTLFSGVTSETKNQGTGQGLFQRLSMLMTQDLESEMTAHESHAPSRERSTTSLAYANVQNDALVDHEDDEFFQEAAKIATSMRSRHPVVTEKSRCVENIIKAEENTVEEGNDPMKVFLRDPMMEVTMHSNDADQEATDQQTTEGKSATMNSSLVQEELDISENGRDEDSLL
jgi:hypothetical protein